MSSKLMKTSEGVQMAREVAFRSVVADLTSAISGKNSEAFTQASDSLMIQANVPGAKAAKRLYEAYQEAAGWQRNEMLAMDSALVNRGLKLER
jgi:hypothetical protein